MVTVVALPSRSIKQRALRNILFWSGTWPKHISSLIWPPTWRTWVVHLQDPIWQGGSEGALQMLAAVRDRLASHSSPSVSIVGKVWMSDFIEHHLNTII